MSAIDDSSAVPPSLERAYARLLFPPSYVVVGAYRLLTDANLRAPAWAKCKHGVVRGACVGFVWTCLTFRIQRGVIETFYMNSPKITGLSQAGFFGYHLPISVPTYAALFFIGQQLSGILKFFLTKNIRIARERAYDATVASRGKGPAFWRPYVEEWARPPRVDASGRRRDWSVSRIMGSFVGRLVLKNLILVHFAFIPMLGLAFSACVRGLATSQYLHRPYFAAKRMTPSQVAVFVEERKWEYRGFGVAAALLEGLPVIGLVFTISNRVGAAMWAHDLEKNQHYVAAQLAAGRPVASISGGTHRVLETAAGDALAAGRAAVDGLKQRVPPPPTADDVPPAYETLTAGREARVPGAM